MGQIVIFLVGEVDDVHEVLGAREELALENDSLIKIEGKALDSSSLHFHAVLKLDLQYLRRTREIHLNRVQLLDFRAPILDGVDLLPHVVLLPIEHLNLVEGDDAFVAVVAVENEGDFLSLWHFLEDVVRVVFKEVLDFASPQTEDFAVAIHGQINASFTVRVLKHHLQAQGMLLRSFFAMDSDVEGSLLQAVLQFEFQASVEEDIIQRVDLIVGR